MVIVVLCVVILLKVDATRETIVAFHTRSINNNNNNIIIKGNKIFTIIKEVSLKLDPRSQTMTLGRVL